MRRERRLLAALLLMAVLGVLAGCGSQEEKQEEPRQEEEEDRIRIGLSFDTFVLERWQRDRDAFVARASELGAEVNVQNANGDVEEQIAQIEYLIEKDVDVIAVIAVDSRGLSDVVAKAKRAGIRVIAYDRLLTDAGVDLYISFDNERIGQMMAECIAANTPAGGKVFMMCGSPAYKCFGKIKGRSGRNSKKSFEENGTCRQRGLLSLSAFRRSAAESFHCPCNGFKS